ncbi:MAG: DUF434 domain-containing protein, partial [Thermoprotei archaeon]
NRKPALDLVVGRYDLSSKERLFLYRCVHSDEEVELVRSKLTENPKELAVDGYNVALTLISVKEGEAYECDDGFFRDLNLGKRKGDPRIFDALKEVCAFLKSRGIDATVFLDYQVSGSGELAARVRDLGCKALAVKNADKESLISRMVVASNDFVVLTKAERVYNLLKDMGYKPPSFASLFS